MATRTGLARCLGCFRVLAQSTHPVQLNQRYLVRLSWTKYFRESSQRIKCRRLSSNPEPISDDQAAQTKSADGLQLSDGCVKQLKKVIGDSNSFLRVLIEGGGCSGFQYKFELDETLAEDDRVFEKDGVKVVTDEASLEYIKGSTIDYHQEMIRTSFQVISNPKAGSGCSCGSSFSLKL